MSDPATQTPPWHRRPVAAVLDALKVDPQRGLSSDSVAARREHHGPNEITETARRGPLRMLAGQFADFMILVLIAAAVVSGLVGDIHDTVAIVVIVLLNAIIGAVQEYRAERAVT
ncbi:MAG: cation-transporting P-type ATPase, partial [Thiogranum sp.]